MADIRIQNAPIAMAVNGTDLIPVSQGDNLPKVITVNQILGMTPTVVGADGLSAYEIAVSNGFVGTEEAWLLSIQGLPGADSTVPGPAGYTPVKGVDYFDGAAGADSTVPGPAGYTPVLGVDYFNGADSTVPGPAGYTPVKGVDYFDGEPGTNGASAYEAAVAGGFVGTEAAWLLSLVGADGADSTVEGPQGIQGVAGADGTAGVGVPVGGTAGQVLSKIDATDYNSEWVDPATGSGLTNPMTTAGDIIIGGASGAPERLAKGTDGQVLALVNGVPAWATGSVTPPAVITVSGELTLYVTQVTTLTITNYNSALTYTVSATAGTVSRLADTITYTAGNTAGSVTLTITNEEATLDSTLTIQAAGVGTPTASTPLDAATAQLVAPTLTASVFAAFGLSTTHLNSDWQVAADAAFTTVVSSSLADATNKTSWVATGLNGSTLYYWRVRYRGANDMVSEYSAPFTFTTAVVSIVQPVNINPATGATDQTTSVTLTASAFDWTGSPDSHLNSDWEVATDAGFTAIVFSSYADATNKTSWTAATLTAGTTYYWRVRYRGVTAAVSAYSAAFSFQTAAASDAYIATPTATPAAFGDAFEGGFYTGMIWNELVQTATSTAIATGSKAFTVADMTSTPIVYSGQALEIRSRANPANPANKMIGVVTGALGTSLTVNVTSVGGSGTFTDWSIMAKYRVIVAPKASGESTGKLYKVDNTAAPTACQTLAEGYKATLAMIAAGDATMYPAAWFCKNLNIGAKTDWYLPARDELELCWRNLKPTADANYVEVDRPNSTINYTNLGSLDDTVITHGTNNNSSPTGAAYIAGTPAQVAAGKNFRTGESEAFAYGSSYYWSASEYSDTNAWTQNWNSSFPGNQNIYGKNGACYVRAVRRSII